jgi:hypothetical protein
MTQPRMMIIAGPPGAGKSSIFSLSDIADNVFNADDRAAELNAGSYQRIPLSVRAVVNREFERFVYSNVSAGNPSPGNDLAEPDLFRAGQTCEREGIPGVHALRRAGHHRAPHRTSQTPRRARGPFGKRNNAA